MGLLDSVSNQISKAIDTVKEKFSAEKVFSFAADLALKTRKTSNWDGLSPYLIAQFFEVEAVHEYGKPIRWRKVKGGKVVKAPFAGEATLSLNLGWQSPFENASSENAAPNMSAMLASGMIQPAMDALSPKKAAEKTSKFLSDFEGRTGITKLNSVQTFNGMQPMDISGTLLFRAWNNGAIEVEEPFNQLIQWALPKNLSEDSTLVNAAKTISGKAEKDRTEEEKNMLARAMFPSEAPVKIGMTYKGKTYMPLVIESVDYQLTSPINPQGHFIYVCVNVKLCSLTALDRNDWNNL